jgi:hypothetical protein
MKDVIVDPSNNNDLVIHNGDFLIADSEQQHIAHLLEADSGQIRQYPRLGVGIRRALNGSVDGEVKRRIQLHCSADGFDVKNITYINGVLRIET